MATSGSKLHDWLDSEFFAQGAFITDFETGKVTLGKGGKATQIDAFSIYINTTFYLKDFFQDEYMAYEPSSTITASLEELQSLTSSWKLGRPNPQNEKNDEDIYRQDFENLKKSFGPALQKVVLVSRESYLIHNNEITRRQLFSQCMSFGSGYPYGIWNDEKGILGSTPELLFSLKHQTLKTFALAGTAKLGEEARLLDSAKDRHEHNLVVDDIREKISSFCEQLKTSETHLLPFKNIVHLKTDITAKLNSKIPLKDITSTLSPTAALGGYPKEASLRFLKDSKYTQTYPQRYFGSALGIVSSDLTQFVVMIRNIQWQKDMFFIESGGGVLPESKLENELEEIRLKRATIKGHYL